ncbi:MAG: protein translocase subunit SecD, partial [Agrococcus casei]
MAKNRTRVGRALIWLFVIAAAVAGLNLYAVQTEDGSWNPKLALDLEGGTQIMLAPLTEEGTSVSSEQLQQAVGIMRQRVNASGVSEAEITTQGGQNIVVSIPGTPDQATRERLMASAKMEFRSVLVMAAAGPAQQPVDPSATGDPAETDPAVSDPAQSDPAESEPAESEPAESGEGGGSEIATETEEPTDEPTESDPAPSEPAEQ